MGGTQGQGGGAGGGWRSTSGTVLKSYVPRLACVYHGYFRQQFLPP